MSEVENLTLDQNLTPDTYVFIHPSNRVDERISTYRDWAEGKEAEVEIDVDGCLEAGPIAAWSPPPHSFVA